MSQVIQFRPARARRPHSDIASLSLRLLQSEGAESPDEDMMDLLLEAETAALGALARARANTVAEAALKLAAAVRRADVQGGEFLTDGDLALLRSVLHDLQRLGTATVPLKA